MAAAAQVLEREDQEDQAEKEETPQDQDHPQKSVAGGR